MFPEGTVGHVGSNRVMKLQTSERSEIIKSDYDNSGKYQGGGAMLPADLGHGPGPRDADRSAAVISIGKPLGLRGNRRDSRETTWPISGSAGHRKTLLLDRPRDARL